MPLIWGWLFIVCLLFGQHFLFAQASQNICNVLNGRGMELLLALGLAAYCNCLCSQGSTMVPCLLAVASLETWGLLKMPCNLSCKIVTASVLCFRPVDFQIVVLKDFFFLPSVFSSISQKPISLIWLLTICFDFPDTRNFFYRKLPKKSLWVGHIF